jgi:SPP1 gp7 family putative phage head morphogenesis protein
MAILLALATRVERGISATVKPVLISVMLQLRRLLQQLSPDGLFRIYEWQRLQTRAVQALLPLRETLRSVLPSALAQMEPGIREQAARFLGLPAPARQIPRAPIELAAESTTSGKTIAEVIDQLPARMAVDLDTTVRTGLLRQDSTEAIADKVIKVVTRQGVETPVIKTGSFANRMLNRVTNAVADVTWNVVNGNVMDIWGTTNQPNWIWSAVLDPKTCPICAPLDGEVRRSPAEFPVQPPVHPNCRCVILPTRRA